MEELGDFFAAIALNEDDPVFDRPTHAARLFERAAEGFEVGVGTLESLNERDRLAGAVLLFEGDVQGLGRRRWAGRFKIFVVKPWCSGATAVHKPAQRVAPILLLFRHGRKVRRNPRAPPSVCPHMLTLRLPLEPLRLAAFLLAAAGLFVSLDLRAQDLGTSELLPIPANATLQPGPASSATGLPVAVLPPDINTCDADFFPDGVVGAYDVLYLLSGFTCPTAECIAEYDLTEDSAVGSADLLVVLSIYGETCDL